MTRRDPISNLETHLGYWLRYVSNHVSHAFKLKVESRGVTVAEWVVLRALFDVEQINPSQLAEQITLTRGAVSKLIDRLVAKGLARKTSEKGDKRFHTVQLTSAGRKLVPHLAELADQNDAEFFGHLSAKEQRALANVLKDIVTRRSLLGVPLE